MNNLMTSNVTDTHNTTTGVAHIPKGVEAVSVTEVEHYTESLFRFRVTRPRAFRFRSGEFAMIGLPAAADARPIFRAYSVASPVWDDTLEFYSIKVPDGPLTSRLAHIAIGDTVLLKPKATGTLVHDALLPGKHLWLLSTGTGIAPFASVIRDLESYEKFDRIILVHGVRTAPELPYGEQIVAAAKNCPLVGEAAQEKLHYYATTTRDDTPHQGRITTLISNHTLFNDLGMPPLNAADDRVMICGSMAMLQDLKDIAEQNGLTEGANSRPGEFVIERAFVG